MTEKAPGNGGEFMKSKLDYLEMEANLISLMALLKKEGKKMDNRFQELLRFWSQISNAEAGEKIKTDKALKKKKDIFDKMKILAVEAGISPEELSEENLKLSSEAALGKADIHGVLREMRELFKKKK